MKLITIVGARPQFIKAAALSRKIKEHSGIEEIIVHTGQHYDKSMSDIFFSELNIPQPKYNLAVGSDTHSKQTARMLEKIEEVLMLEKPDALLVFGDTNSTLAGALSSVKLGITTIHVEAGLRSYNRSMPEEINRIATDHISDLLFAPTQNALDILKSEGLGNKSLLSGDIMLDAIDYYKTNAKSNDYIDKVIGNDSYFLCTIHRQENTDDIEKLSSLFDALSQINTKIILPLHPRTKSKLEKIKIKENIKVIDPVGYLEMIHLLKNSTKVLTDSGGLQKEAFFMKKPCVTLRDETEWIETLNGNWNIIVGTETEKILKAVDFNEFGDYINYFGDGNAADFIIKNI